MTFEAPLLIRRIGTESPGPFKEEVAKNVSLAGVYFETEEGKRYTLDDIVMVSVSIPETHRSREFPFTRLAGRSRVVRVESLSDAGASPRKRFGIALEFGDDVTALTAIPARS